MLNVPRSCVSALMKPGITRTTLRRLAHANSRVRTPVVVGVMEQRGEA